MQLNQTPLLPWPLACKLAESWIHHSLPDWRQQLEQTIVALERGKSSIESVTRRTFLRLKQIFGKYSLHEAIILDRKRSRFQMATWVPFRSESSSGIQLMLFTCERGTLKTSSPAVTVTQHVLARLAERMGTDSLDRCLQELRPAALAFLFRDNPELQRLLAGAATLWMATQYGLLISVPHEADPEHIVLTTWVDALLLNGWQDVYHRYAFEQKSRSGTMELRYVAVTDAQDRFWLVHMAEAGAAPEPCEQLGKLEVRRRTGLRDAA